MSVEKMIILGKSYTRSQWEALGEGTQKTLLLGVQLYRKASISVVDQIAQELMPGKRGINEQDMAAWIQKPGNYDRAQVFLNRWQITHAIIKPKI